MLPEYPEEEERVEMPVLLAVPPVVDASRTGVVVRGAISVRVRVLSAGLAATLVVTSGARAPEVRVRLSPLTAGAVSLVPVDRVVAGRE